MKLRTFFYTLAAIVLVLLLIGAGGFYWIKSQSPVIGLRDGKLIDPQAAIFVPKQAPVMASLLVNPDKLETFRLLAVTPGERRKARSELNKLKQTVLANTGVDYRRDIKPWVGDEITFAITTPDIDRNSQNGFQPGYLVAVAAKEPEQGELFQDVFWQKQAAAGANLVSEQYKGVKPIDSNAGKSQKKIPPLATAAVGDGFVLFANDPKVLRDAMDNVQAPELNLTSSGDYQQALQRLKQRQIGLTYVNLPTLTAWLGNQTKETPASANESLGIALGFNPQGLLAQLALLGNEEVGSVGDEANKIHPLEKPVGALQYLPANTAFAAAGSDLQQLCSLSLQPTI